MDLSIDGMRRALEEGAIADVALCVVTDVNRDRRAADKAQVAEKQVAALRLRRSYGCLSVTEAEHALRSALCDSCDASVVQCSKPAWMPQQPLSMSTMASPGCITRNVAMWLGC